jgi:hypothetical protein
LKDEYEFNNLYLHLLGVEFLKIEMQIFFVALHLEPAYLHFFSIELYGFMTAVEIAASRVWNNMWIERDSFV